MPDETVNGKLVVTDKIGIGIEESIAQLHIASSTPAPSQTFLESSGVFLKLNVDANGAAIGTDNAFPLTIKTDDTPRISINNVGNISLSGALSVQNTLSVSGNVGISTTSPSYKLAITTGDINYESLGRSTGHKEIGVTAQEVEAVFPELVTTWGDESYKAVDYGRLTGVLIEAAKELKAENEALKQRIEALERAIEKK